MGSRLYCPDCGEYLEGGDGDCHDCRCGWKQPGVTVTRSDLVDEFNQLMEESMTVGERYSNEGQQKLDRIMELRDILGLWDGEMVATY